MSVIKRSQQVTIDARINVTVDDFITSNHDMPFNAAAVVIDLSCTSPSWCLGVQ